MLTQSEVHKALHLGEGWYSDVGIGKYKNQLLVRSPRFDTEFIMYVRSKLLKYVGYKYRRKEVEDANKL